MPQEPANTQEELPPAIRIVGVSKAFGRNAVLQDLHLEVGWGQVLAVLGPNGSGKSTLLKILATLTQADFGQVQIAGMDIESRGAQVRRLIGVVTHDAMHYAALTVAENLRLHANLFGLEDPQSRVDVVSETMGIASILNVRAGSLSHGQQRRLSIARALLHDPPLLLLDEPESGLDQEALTRIRSLIEESKQAGKSILLTTHNLHWGLQLADRAVLLNHGRVEYDSDAAGVVQSAVEEAYSALHGYER